jgi:hypothetical protein
LIEALTIDHRQPVGDTANLKFVAGVG